MESPQTVGWFSAMRTRARQRDEMRGYTISYKRLSVAYAAELIIIVASLYGAWLFAQTYGKGDFNTVAMMMLAPVGYAVIEFCRVPLAVSVRTQRSFFIKTLACVGVIAAAGVTIKSMSQLGEVMFRPRLIDVVRAKATLEEAKDEQTSLGAKIAAADKLVAEQEDARKGAEKRLLDALLHLSQLPAQKCGPVSGTDRRGNPYRTTRCSTDPRTATIDQTLKNANVEVDTITAKLDAARAERARLDPAVADTKVITAEVVHKEAVLNSQLHSFTAMVFAKEPAQVTDAEIHEFLRVFVFAPAMFVSIASTLLTLTSVEKIKKKPEPILLSDEAGSYILGPYAQEILKEAVTAAEQSAKDAIEQARPMQHPPLKVVSGADL